jgi:hypothetical protein
MQTFALNAMKFAEKKRLIFPRKLFREMFLEDFAIGLHAASLSLKVVSGPTRLMAALGRKQTCKLLLKILPCANAAVRAKRIHMISGLARSIRHDGCYDPMLNALEGYEGAFLPDVNFVPATKRALKDRRRPRCGDDL